MTTVEIPVRLGRGQNDREHHYVRARRVKKEKNDTYCSLLAARVPIPVLPLVVTITRVAPTALTHPLDDDNLAGCAKAVRDSIAMWIGVDDGDDRIAWRYAQAKGQPGRYAVRVTFEARV